ncbi:MAG: putative inorganic carbon transporter subunit DabA, partial [Candidatus Sedimenticola sp. 20ELBAFRAG]
MPNTTSTSVDLRQQLKEALEHFAHVLPGQAPIKDFVHHNTLHGFQHLSFFDALKAAHDITGAYGYLPAEKFREYFSQGRITEADLDSALDQLEELDADDVVAHLGNTQLA